MRNLCPIFFLALVAARATADDLVLRDTLWQTLPDSVVSVCVGPDQRIWRHAAATDSRDIFKAEVEREFARPSPLTQGVFPILFEPKGRVWFSGTGESQLVIRGYDGKTWIDHPVRPAHHLYGLVPNHAAGRPGYGENLYVDGTCFFRDTLGIDCYNGRDWTYQEFTEKPAAYPGFALSVEVDGKGVVAVVPGDKPAIWRWRAGRWSQACPPASLPRLVSAAPARDGIWLRTDRALRFHPYDPVIPDPVKRLLVQLESPDAADKAADDLAAMGPAIAPAIERAIADAADQPKRASRLRNILAALDHQPEKVPTFPFGPYRLKFIQLFLALPDHSACALADNVYDGDKDLGPGVVLVAPDGAARVVSDPAFVRALRRDPGTPAESPIALDDHTIWVAPSSETAASLLDLREGKVKHILPDTARRRPVAARADGSLFVTKGVRSPITLYTPGKPDDRPTLPAETALVAAYGPVVASDGIVYALKPGGALERYDGKQWDTVVTLPKAQRLDFALPGVNGDVLLKADRTYAIVGLGGPPVIAADLHALIKDNRARLLPAYAPGVRGQTWGTFHALYADPAKNLWLLAGERLTVLSGDQWLDVDQPFRAAGSRVGTVRYLAPIGDAGKFYFSGFGGRDSVVGQIVDAKFVLTPAPPDSYTDFPRLVAYPAWLRNGD